MADDLIMRRCINIHGSRPSDFYLKYDAANRRRFISIITNKQVPMSEIPKEWIPQIMPLSKGDKESGLLIEREKLIKEIEKLTNRVSEIDVILKSSESEYKKSKIEDTVDHNAYIKQRRNEFKAEREQRYRDTISEIDRISSSQSTDTRPYLVRTQQNISTQVSPYSHEDKYKIVERNSNNTNNCSICMSEIEDDIIGILKCDHYFHITCIDPWLLTHDSCPNCRYQLTDQS
jgi:hypothetical protein